MVPRKRIIVAFSIILFSAIFYLYSGIVAALKLEEIANPVFLRILEVIDYFVATMIYYSREAFPGGYFEPFSWAFFLVDSILAFCLLKIPQKIRRTVIARSSISIAVGIILLVGIIEHEINLGGYIANIGCPLFWIFLHSLVVVLLFSKKGALHPKST